MSPASDTVADRFASIAKTFPDAVAVQDETAEGQGTRFSYRQLYQDAQALADELRNAGVRPTDLVAISMPAGHDIVVAFLAVWLAGASYLPLDHFGPLERNEQIVFDASPKALLTLTAARSMVSCPSDPVIVQDRYVLALLAEPQQSPVDTAYVIYTSGTTGVPKGVPVSHRNLSSLFDATEPWFDVGADDVWLVFHSFAFDFSVWELWGALSTGGMALIPDRWVVRDPRQCAQLILHEHVSVLSQTPNAFHKLLPELCSGDATELAVRYVVFGGERLLPGFLAKFQKVSSAVLYNMYGITEITVHATIRAVTREDIESNTSSIGQVLDGFTPRIVDESDAEIENSAVGELLLAGPQVVEGYLNRPQLTQERFIRCDGRLYYRSGDLVRRERDGMVYIGRGDDQVKVRGFRVELGEVDQALQTVDGVSTAVAVAVAGEGDTYLACAYVTSDGTEVANRWWRRALAGRLPAYMIPEVFVRVTTIPQTQNGKVDRKTLEKSIGGGGYGR